MESDSDLTAKELITKIKKALYALDMTESMQVGNNVFLRVPDGWVLTVITPVGDNASLRNQLTGREPMGQGGQVFVSTIFVPFSDEFNIKTWDQIATKMGKESDDFYALKTGKNIDPNLRKPWDVEDRTSWDDEDIKSE